ncbi:orexin receptor type 2 [Venturia canescens]|uniref:orexin receptor type 2 n=1 Tax=Venturia canescens TaxID=32260 RepID=UPI001C9D6433|nr:orexin receptor type 2 [Venturia canescens]
MKASPEENLVVFTPVGRTIFQTIIWPTLVVGLIGNFGVVFRIVFNDTSKNTALKPFYRSALLSLALADILLLLTSGSNVLGFVAQSTVLWSLPIWTCTFIPYLQTVGVLVASLTLAGVAIDRYAAIKSKFPLTKGLKWRWAISFVLGLWIVSFAAAYPVIGTFAIERLVVINGSTFYTGALCITKNRSEASVIYTALFVVIFVPLAIVFLLVHVLLARNIWQRDSPGDNTHQRSTNDSQLSNDNSTVSTSLGKAKNTTAKKIGGTPSHVARKRRTVRVILVLIFVFVLCRLPHWSFVLFKLHTTTSDNYLWYIQMIFTIMSLLNAAIHPFLYAFLNEALSLIAWLRRRFTETRYSTNASAHPISKEEIGSAIRAKVEPRGPYYSP